MIFVHVSLCGVNAYCSYFMLFFPLFLCLVLMPCWSGHMNFEECDFGVVEGNARGIVALLKALNNALLKVVIKWRRGTREGSLPF